MQGMECKAKVDSTLSIVLCISKEDLKSLTIGWNDISIIETPKLLYDII